MGFRQPGPWLFALGMIGLGLVQIAFQACLPGLKPLPPGWEPVPAVAVAMGAVLALAGAGLLVERARRIAGWVLAVFWIGWLLAGHVAALAGGFWALSSFVAPLEVAVFAATAWMLGGAGARGHLAARGALALTLLLFGTIHVLHPDAIAGMIPGWMPLASTWPWITGAVQIAAGLMVLTGVQAALGAFVVGLMWLGWVIVLHAPRVIAAPGDLFEWTFMLTAVALAGAAWSVGERFAPVKRRST